MFRLSFAFKPALSVLKEVLLGGGLGNTAQAGNNGMMEASI